MGAQKFAYLRAQLEGDAARVIAGFPLTDSNYLPAVTQLQERFGQEYKIIDAHLEALLHVETLWAAYSHFMTPFRVIDDCYWY